MQDHHKSTRIDDDQEEEDVSYSQVRYYTAIVSFIVSSILYYGGLPTIPFLPFSKKTKVILFISTYSISQILFYGSLLLGGPIFYRKVKKYLHIEKIKAIFRKMYNTISSKT